jgi:pilus assembly protein Flp/PilA
LGVQLPLTRDASYALNEENGPMKDFLTKLYVKVQIFREDNGQDLIEYALVAALIALAATAGMNTVANDISTAFNNIGAKLTTYT